jgi:hypothetical protein
MTVWARNDIRSVNVPAEGFGGCGKPHIRAEGETSFAVTCEPCEQHLRTDQNWSSRPEDVPLSHDQVAAQEAAEKNLGRRQLATQDAVAGMLAMAFAPRDLLAGATQAALPAAGPPCHRCQASVLPNARYCGSCGSPILREVEAAAS